VCASEHFNNLIGHTPDRFVLPCSQYLPSGSTESRVDGAVACNVASQLWSPVVGVHARLVAMNRARVPKAAIDEHRKPRPRERDVRANDAAWNPERKIFAEPEPTTVQL
jgi:hypothetical protein